MQQKTPAARVVLLGASNLTLALADAVSAAHLLFAGCRLEVVAAAGCGRSYGARSQVLLRALPGITTCGLWSQLQELPPSPTYALVTDIGNDLAFGHSPATVASWVATCLERLQTHRARVVLTRLPLDSLRRLGVLRYLLVRKVLFPRYGSSLAELRQAATELDQQLVNLGQRYDAALLTPDRSWYRLDTIHLHRRGRLALLAATAAGWSGRHETLRPASPWETVRCRLFRPQQQWLGGLPAGRPQPCGILGTAEISLF